MLEFHRADAGRPFALAEALSESGFGGVLADDMGLGKTVQTLALLAHRHLDEKSERPSLLVVPTSLADNRRREAARFVPGLVPGMTMGKAGRWRRRRRAMPASRRKCRGIPSRRVIHISVPCKILIPCRV